MTLNFFCQLSGQKILLLPIEIVRIKIQHCLPLKVTKFFKNISYFGQFGFTKFSGGSSPEFRPTLSIRLRGDNPALGELSIPNSPVNTKVGCDIRTIVRYCWEAVLFRKLHGGRPWKWLRVTQAYVSTVG